MPTDPKDREMVEGPSVWTPSEMLAVADRSSAHVPITSADRKQMALGLFFQGYPAGRACEIAFVELEDNDGALQMLARHRLSSTPTTGASAPGEAQPAQWAVEAERAAAEAYAQNMGDPDGKDETSAARRDAALAIEQHALAALRPSPQDERVARLEEALREIVEQDDEQAPIQDLMQHDRNAGYLTGVRDCANIARAALSSDQGGEKGHG